MGCGNITQRVNLPFVRLTLQIVDMLELLSDLISKGDESERPLLSQDPSLTSPQDRIDGVQPLRAKFPHGHVKCWRIMYQVVDLYSSLPREAKNNEKRRSNIGRVLGGKLKREILFTDVLLQSPGWGSGVGGRGVRGAGRGDTPRYFGRDVLPCSPNLETKHKVDCFIRFPNSEKRRAEFFKPISRGVK